MLQDIPTPTLREASSCVLETERLMLRRPTLADVKAIARLANDRRIAENTRRLPHPYSQDHAIEFVREMADDQRQTVFLIENNHTPIGVVGINWPEPAAPELGYWLGVDFWGQGFATEAATAARTWLFEHSPLKRAASFIRPGNLASKRVVERLGAVCERTFELRGSAYDYWVHHRPVDDRTRLEQT